MVNKGLYRQESGVDGKEKDLQVARRATWKSPRYHFQVVHQQFPTLFGAFGKDFRMPKG